MPSPLFPSDCNRDTDSDGDANSDCDRDYNADCDSCSADPDADTMMS